MSKYSEKQEARRAAKTADAQPIESIPATAPVTPLVTLPGLDDLLKLTTPFVVKNETVAALKADAHLLAKRTKELDQKFREKKQEWESAEVELQGLLKMVDGYRHELLRGYYANPELQAAMKTDPNGVVEAQMLKVAKEQAELKYEKELMRIAFLVPEVKRLHKEMATAEYEAKQAGDKHRAKFAEAEAEEKKEVALAAA